MDPNIAKIIERTRARRAGAGGGTTSGIPSTAGGRSPVKNIPIERREGPARSPLKPHNFDDGPSPTKKKVGSGEMPASPSDTVKRLLSRESLETSVQELISRESPGKTVLTRVVSTKSYSPHKTTITKTVVTEKEEKYERKETITYSGNKEFLQSLDQDGGNIHEKIRKLDSYTSSTEKGAGANTETTESSSRQTRTSSYEAGASRNKSSSGWSSPMVAGPGKANSRPGSTTASPSKSSWSPTKVVKENIAFNLDQVNEPIVEDDYLAGRKARLASLANKFKNMEDDDFRHISLSPDTRDAPPSPARKHSPVKTDHLRSRSPEKTPAAGGNAMQFIQSPAKKTVASEVGRSYSPHRTVAANSPLKTVRSQSPIKTVRSVSPTRAVMDTNKVLPVEKGGDDSLLSSLKAQGFMESESASKLIYDFEKEERERRRSLSPVKPRDRSVSPQKHRDRSVSPVKSAIQTFEPDSGSAVDRRGVAGNERGRAASRTPAILSSPSKTAVAPRSVSPSKPHPLQFVSAQVAAAAAAAGPPKPSRTFEAATPQPSVKSWKMQVEHSESHGKVPASEAGSDNRCDTPVAQSVSQRRSMWESKMSPEPEPVDPAMIPLSERKKLFEKNKSVPTPVARFGESVTPAMLAKAPANDAMTPAEAWKRKRALSPNRPMPSAKRPSPEGYVASASKTKTPGPPVPRKPSTDIPPSPATPHVGRKAAELHKKLFENASADWRGNEIAQKVAEQKQKEMDLLLNRYNHLKESGSGGEQSCPPPPPPPPPGSARAAKKSPEKSKKESPIKNYPGLNSMKNVKVSPPKPGNLYPEIAYDSDTVSSRCDSVMSSDTMNSSFESVDTHHSGAPSLGREIVHASRKQADGQLSTIEERNDSMDTEEGDTELSESVVCAEIDDMLDEAMGEDSEEEEEMDGDLYPSSTMKMPKGSSSSSGSSHVGRSDSTTSWEFHTPQTKPKRRESDGKFKTPLILYNDSPSKVPQVEIEGEEGPLQHTVSFYRKQRPATQTPIVQRIVLNPVLESAGETVPDSPRATISQKIKVLQEEANSQMSVISQASRALNLCRSTREFHGSSEQVEGERLLLVASHKRAAALSEISRLKTEGGLGADPAKEQSCSVRGTVSICGISLGLKKDFIKQLRSGEGGEFVHYFLCLVKCAGQVIPTQMVSTLEGLDGTTLDFPNLINLSDLPKNFLVQLEVYGLQTRREVLGHEAKYHINRKEKSSMFHLTPKLKMSKTESRLTRPDMSSPGGPHTVRTSCFAMVGNTVITIDSLKRKDWRLESVPPISPLEGNIRFKLNCHSESQVSHRGFLTMFDDVSGFGAWHRRWFVLEGNRLSYWKYPENQNKQAPIGSLDLGVCITENVTICPREICSRMHTFMLESARPAKTTDRESLVLVRQGTTSITRHLLSADSREERLVWSQILNQALDNLRAWDSTDFRPRAGSTSSSESGSTATSTSTEIW